MRINISCISNNRFINKHHSPPDPITTSPCRTAFVYSSLVFLLFIVTLNYRQYASIPIANISSMNTAVFVSSMEWTLCTKCHLFSQTWPNSIRKTPWPTTIWTICISGVSTSFVSTPRGWVSIQRPRPMWIRKYLSQLSTAVQMMENKGIYALLDCHQDIFSRYFCGEGVPDWVAKKLGDDVVNSFPFPVAMNITRDPTTKYPVLDECLSRTFAEYYVSEAVMSGFNML